VFQLSWLPGKLVHVPGHSREDSGVLVIFTTKRTSKRPSKKLFSNFTNVKIPQHRHGQLNYCNLKILKKKRSDIFSYGVQMQCRDAFQFRIRRYIRLAYVSQLKYLYKRIMKPSTYSCANHDKLSVAPHHKVHIQRNCVTVQCMKSSHCDARCWITTALPDTIMMALSVSEQARGCEIRGLYSSFIENSGLLGCDTLSFD